MSINGQRNWFAGRQGLSRICAFVVSSEHVFFIFTRCYCYWRLRDICIEWWKKILNISITHVTIVTIYCQHRISKWINQTYKQTNTQIVILNKISYLMLKLSIDDVLYTIKHNFCFLFLNFVWMPWHKYLLQEEFNKFEFKLSIGFLWYIFQS